MGSCTSDELARAVAHYEEMMADREALVRFLQGEKKRGLSLHLSAADVAQLRAAAQDITSGGPSYGTALSVVVDEWGQGREWLEAAILAGHVPYQEGIVLALRANHLWWRAFLKDEEGRGADPAFASLVNDYRAMVALIQGFIAELGDLAVRYEDEQRAEEAAEDEQRDGQEW